MSTSDLQSEADDIAMLILRAAISEQSTREKSTVPDLHAISKPVRCRAETVDGFPKIACETVAVANPQFPITWLSRAQSRTSDKTTPQILLVGANENRKVSAEGLEAFAEQYAIDVPHTVASDFPDDAQSSQGLRWVVRFFGPGRTTQNVDDLDLPEPYRTIVKERFDEMRRRS